MATNKEFKMTKAELIGKIAKLNGVPAAEEKIFFEMFLRESAGILMQGGIIRLNNIGTFQLKAFDSDEKDEASSLVIYFENEIKDDLKDALIFSLPSEEEEEAIHFVDSYFSLSIDKPVIPLRRVNEEELIFPVSGDELNRLLESKAMKLLEEAEILKEEDINPAASELNKEITEAPQQINETSEEDSNKEKGEEEKLENIPWDFGEDISPIVPESQQVESKDLNEKEIINIKETAVQIESDIIEEKSDLVEVKPELLPEADQPSAEIGEESKQELIAEELIIQPEGDEEPTEKEQIEINVEEGGYQQVKSKVDEIDNLIDQIDNDTDDYSFDLPASKLDKLYSSESKQNDEIVDEKGFTEVRLNLTADEQDAETKNKGEDYFTKDIKDYISQLEERNKADSKKKKRATIFAVLGFIILIASGAYLYFNFVVNKNLLNGTNIAGNPTAKGIDSQKPAVVDRNYDIPVNYPYSKDEKKNGYEAIDKNALASDENNQADQDGINENKSLVESNANIAIEKIKGNIYKQGETYIVQVSSWKSKYIADDQVKKLTDKGFNAYVEKSSLGSSGIYYRVRVRGFNSLEEAEEFSK